MNYLEKDFIDTLNLININGIDEISGKKLSEIIENIAPNYCGINNNILAYFDNINFITENERGIQVSQDNILTKKGIVYSNRYEKNFEFKNNVYTYDIVKNENDKLERTNFKIIDSSSAFDKLNMFNFDNGMKFFDINKMIRSEEYHNNIYNTLYEINQVGFNNEVSLKFNKLFEYIDSYDIQRLLSSLAKKVNEGENKEFRIYGQKGDYKLIPCIEDITASYDEDPYQATTFEKDEFLELNNKEKALDTIYNELSNIVYYDYSLREI